MNKMNEMLRRTMKGWIDNCFYVVGTLLLAPGFSRRLEALLRGKALGMWS
jgi:hypothetical protein